MVDSGVAMNVGKTIAHEAFYDVVNALDDFRNELIKFPTTEAEKAACIATFETSDLPNIAGAIDGTHVKIKAPNESAVDYFSQYQQHDVVVQGIVDGRKYLWMSPLAFPVACMMRKCCGTYRFMTEQIRETFSQHRFIELAVTRSSPIW